MRSRLKILLSALLITGCCEVWAQVDSQATRQTLLLYRSMKSRAADSLMYGQHHAYELGTYADGQGNMSDCKHITGENPAVVGYDFTKSTLWSPSSTNTAYHQQAVAHYLRGGINTFSWHAKNPSPDGTGDGRVKDPTGNPVQGILTPNSPTRANYNAMLDDIASFFNHLQIDGVHVPILWRPLHENTGSWFWWGADHCTPSEFQQLWQYTYNYLTHTQGVHNLLWAYSPSKPASESHYLERYPTDPYVDLLGFDYYGNSEEAGYDAAVLNSARVTAGLAQACGKLSAMTEGGESNGFSTTTRTNFFTAAWLGNYKNDPVATHLSYVLTWNSTQFSTFPPPGTNRHLHADFMTFYHDAYTVFLEGMHRGDEDVAKPK